MVTKTLYGTTPQGEEVIEYSLINGRGVELKVISYGCTITSLKIPDRYGAFEDVVLGYDSLKGYLKSKHYLGSVIGRYANRIYNGSFSLGGQYFSLAKNQHPHHLHGGNRGFDKIVWHSMEFENENGMGVDFHYLSPEGEEGYPGSLQVSIRYFLTHGDAIIINYLATTDQRTIVNLTQHSYFNLHGGSNTILNHELQINTGQFLPVDDSLIPTGKIKDVEGSPFDFRSAKLIGRDIFIHDDQLKIANGYDHNFVLNKTGHELAHAATLYDPESGRRLEVHTSEPGLQLYTCNFLDDSVPGKNDANYGPYSGVCLETQHFPDTPNHTEFPNVELNPGEQFESTTIWMFGLK